MLSLNHKVLADFQEPFPREDPPEPDPPPEDDPDPGSTI